VVQKALRQSVRVEVQVAGKLVRAASGVVVAAEDGHSYVLTNQHVVQREGLRGSATFLVVIERPKLHRLEAKLVSEGTSLERGGEGSAPVAARAGISG